MPPLEIVGKLKGGTRKKISQTWVDKFSLKLFFLFDFACVKHAFKHWEYFVHVKRKSGLSISWELTVDSFLGNGDLYKILGQWIHGDVKLFHWKSF